MLDTKGPEIRTGKLANKTLELKPGQEINVVPDPSVVGDENQISLDYKELAHSVKGNNNN